MASLCGVMMITRAGSAANGAGIPPVISSAMIQSTRIALKQNRAARFVRP
jgi:hypothetical protein